MSYLCLHGEVQLKKNRCICQTTNGSELQENDENRAVSIYKTQKMKWHKLWIIRIYIHQSTTEDSERLS
jgi:hypothetical protein